MCACDILVLKGENGVLAKYLQSSLNEGGAAAATAVVGMVGLAGDGGVRARLATPSIVRRVAMMATAAVGACEAGVRANALGLLCNLRSFCFTYLHSFH